MEQLAGEIGGLARVAKVNVDDCPEAAQRMGVRGIPSVLLIRDGKVLREIETGSAKAMRAQIEREL